MNLTTSAINKAMAIAVLAFQAVPMFAQEVSGPETERYLAALDSEDAKEIKDALAAVPGEALSSLSGEYNQTARVLHEIYQRATNEKHPLFMKQEEACGAVAAVILSLQDQRSRSLGLSYWRRISGGEVALPESVVRLVFDEMLGDTSNVGPSLKVPDVPQDFAADVLALETKRHEALLLEMLGRESVADRLAAVLVFAKSSAISQPATRRLIDQLRKERDAAVAMKLADAFGQFRFFCDEAVEVLLESLDQAANKSGYAARSVSRLTGKIQPETCSLAADALARQQAESIGLSNRWELLALRGLIGKLPDEHQQRLVAQLLPLAKQESTLQFVRLSVIAESGVNGAIAIPLIKELIARSEADDSANLANFLWNVERKPGSVLPIFTAAIHSEDSMERHYGLQGFEAMQADAVSAIPEIVKLLSSKKSGTRVSALRCLRDLGKTAKKAHPEVEKLLSATSERERLAAVEAFAAITAK